MKKEFIGIDCLIYFEFEDGTCGCKRVISSLENDAESIEKHFNKFLASMFDKTAHFIGYEQFVPGGNIRFFEIFSSEGDFKLSVPENIYRMTVKHIWTRPEYYANVKSQSSESYYGFLKYLWIRLPGGEELRLADVVQTFLEED